MKFKILIIIETIVLAFFVTLSIIKNGEAEKQFIRADEQTALAKQNAKKTEEFKAIAESEVMKAERAAADAIMAETALQKCLKGK